MFYFKLLCRAVADCFALFVLCYFIQVLLSRYRSCLLARGNISRLALRSARIELKLRRFRKPTFMVLKFGACCKYLTSIS